MSKKREKKGAKGQRRSKGKWRDNESRQLKGCLWLKGYGLSGGKKGNEKWRRVYHIFPNIRDQKIFLQHVSTCVFTHYNIHTHSQRGVCVWVWRQLRIFLRMAGGHIHDLSIICSFVLSHTASLWISVHIQDTHLNSWMCAHRHAHTALVHTHIPIRL